MKFESFVAKRYLISKHKVNFITIITLISVIGITIGVAALIVVLSVFNGFGSLVTSYLMNFDPQLRIELISSKSNNIDVETALKSQKEILNYAPYVSGKVLAYNQGLTKVVTLKGIDKKNSTDIYDINSSILFGDFNLDKKGNIPRVVIGLRLADHLQSLIGDTITVISPTGIEESITIIIMNMMNLSFLHPWKIAENFLVTQIVFRDTISN
jgi:lipoprotein-releasing system permease protein